MILQKYVQYALCFCVGILYSINVNSQSELLQSNWNQYFEPEDVGFSSSKLQLIAEQLASSQTASVLVLYRGNVLFSYGENTRKYMLHSIRKSIMNAMIGVEIKNGSLRLDQTLGELNIDDKDKLTDREKVATIKDLISARSGIYHPSAYSTRSMIANLPERGSHKPGDFWYYNNWDFNALLSIYEQQTGKRFFEAFENEIAKPIGMEDFELSDCFYRLEEDISLHPAYLFRMSARDMARFGQLYLQNGKWNNKQLIPSDWIHQSTQAISTDLENFSDREAYGYLWWVSSIDDQKMYSASGSGGHKIIVLPESDMVIVHRVNSYENKIVEEKNINAIVSQILNAQLSKKQKSNPTLIPYSPVLKKFSTKYLGSMDKYLGTYKHRVLGEMTIQKSAKKYELKNGVGVFELFPQSESSFAPEDLESLIEMKEAKSEKQRYSIEPNFSPDGSLISVVFYYLP